MPINPLKELTAIIAEKWQRSFFGSNSLKTILVITNRIGIKPIRIAKIINA
tara:strand:+ start:102 stop:254 length:153 start_codon:yes stop_codon:yes gene_type:complete